MAGEGNVDFWAPSNADEHETANIWLKLTRMKLGGIFRRLSKILSLA